MWAEAGRADGSHALLNFPKLYKKNEDLFLKDFLKISELFYDMESML
jgi:hypothetical protein